MKNIIIQNMKNKENDVGTEMDVKKSTTKRSKAVKRESGSVNKQVTKERLEGAYSPGKSCL